MISNVPLQDRPNILSSHHVTIGTDEDPATARKGENVYIFYIRSTIMGHINAWKHELKRLQKKGNHLLSFKNRMITGYMMSALWVWVFFIAGGIFGLILFLGQAAFAKLILEVVNYMEHYGLIRKPGTPILPRHSWNTNKRISSIFLYNLTRHSSHHENASLDYWELKAYPDAPEMPGGYLSSVYLVLFTPWIYYRIMAPKLKD